MDEIRSTPAIAPDGTLHVLTGDGSLYAVGPTGEVAWRFRVPGLADRIPPPPAIGQDGTIYVGSWDHNLYAIAPGGSERWQFLTAGPVRAPTVGADGTIYVASTRVRDPATFTVPTDLLALDRGGTERWRVVLGGHVAEGPALGPGGTITVASDDSIYVLGPGGAKLWTAVLGSIHAPLLAEDGSIYLGHPILSALDPEGVPRWEYGTRGFQDTAPAIGLDGTVYAGTYDGVVAQLLAFTELGVNNGGYAAAPWPQPRGDRANTGRAPPDP
jgi:outer membrane protein assembly factor BamB